MHLIYLDNAATTKCDDEVARLMQNIQTGNYGNPSSAHKMGLDAEMQMRRAYESVAKTLKCSPKEILFTSGGTEADNLALLGAARAYARQGRRVITTRMEHPAVLEAVRQLEKEGFDVVYLPVDKEGVVDLQALSDALTPETVLVSVMAVNNETGSVQPLSAIGSMIKERCPKAVFHTDAVQGYGKIPLDIRQAKIDLLSASAHKLHGPKGAGFLYIRNGIRLIPLIFGGGQQTGLRSGTENVAGYAGCALAAAKAFESRDSICDRLYELRTYFCNAVSGRIPDVTVNGAEAVRHDRIASHIISLSVRGVRAEVLLHALEDKNIFVSAGSACAARHPRVSETLMAIGLEEDLALSTIRISLSKYTTKEEIDGTLDALEALVPQLRRFRAQ